MKPVLPEYCAYKARLPYRYCSKNITGYRRHPRSVVAYSAEVVHRGAVPIWQSFRIQLYKCKFDNINFKKTSYTKDEPCRIQKEVRQIAFVIAKVDMSKHDVQNEFS